MFAAKRSDGRANWRVVYDLVRVMQPDDVISYEEIQNALETESRTLAQSATRDAIKRLRTKDQRTLRAVPTVGYRMLYAKEHDEQAWFHQERGRRQVEVGLSILTNTRIDELTPEERRRHEGNLLCFGGLQVQLDHLTARLRRLELLGGDE